MSHLGTWWPPRGRSADALLACAVFACLAAARVAETLENPDKTVHLGLGWVLLFLATAALTWRRRYPVAVAILTFALCAAFYPLTEPDGPLLIVPAIALYTATAHGHPVVAGALSGLALAGTWTAELTSDETHLADASMYLMVGWFVAVLAIGGVVRNRRAYLAEAARRAREAERFSAQEGRRQATEERLRIARDLHDGLGHNISLINVQASAALHTLGRDPDAAERALTEIKRASRETLRELREALGMLRGVDEPSPPPGLAGIASLAGRAGREVSVDVSGEPRPVPAATGDAAYRVVQEALTNVARHSDAATVRVTVGYVPDAVVVRVEDDGPPRTSAEPGSGTGLRGLRARVESLGGTFTGGPAATGFAVEARLPTPAR
ncbi:sensor histidine kinase [Actinomadura flavalba]|uniref:sensor histidine kinase n=1 Tax=Actinomadura flavalba TaxID=1120938 RepID=UPI00146D1EF8|nr:sensor histidine kinase [Actinomadura flavalba]